MIFFPKLNQVVFVQPRVCNLNGVFIITTMTIRIMYSYCSEFRDIWLFRSEDLFHFTKFQIPLIIYCTLQEDVFNLCVFSLGSVYIF